ncbi:hypothetical protein C7271_17540 [filamentous cyanobacterium CCP5]|nr:hypothetical protein C7271_17540 [filamentous cyanobacterium CCP5]
MSSNSVLEAFFLGRALAETLSEKTEQALTEALSQLGKFDAEQRENLREFTETVAAKAHEAQASAHSPSAGSPQPESGQDLQAVIDTLRAEIAQTRVALQQYRSS